MINILVIEDDVSIREIINYNLSNKFSVLTADNAEEGLEICQEEKIDLILLDWMLPGISGLSFLRTIKKKGYKKIQIHKIPHYGAGIAINDRIKRASKF